MAYLVKGAPFKYNGAVDVSDCKTSKDVMKKAKLDWLVSKCELVAKMPMIGNNNSEGFIHNYNNYVECPNAYATYRTDTNTPLGIVKERYTPVQNIEAFRFFDDAIGKDSAIWQTAGYFGNGERIFVSAKLPNNILVNDDPVDNYLVFTTSHDGTSGVKILFTPIRVICQNTLNAAIKQSTNFVSFRHTKSVYESLDIASEILGICKEKTQYLNELYNDMNNTKISDDDAQNIFARVILNEKEIENVVNTGHNLKQIVYRDFNAISDAQISMKKVNVISEINNYYYSGIGQKEILGTKWGVYNAITGYYSNIDNTDGIKRMDSLLFGDRSRKIEFAGNILTSKVA